jgi:hypothetical protein
MADTKITALAAIGANPIIPSTFPIPMVDLTDTSMAASGTTKKVTVNQILGAGGTATLASATITGDLTVDTSTLKVDSANNRVGVNTASPAQALDVASGNLQVRTGGTIYSDTFSNYGAALAINAAGSLPLRLQIGGSNAYEITSANVHTWQNVGGVAGTAMTLNSTGLGIGGTPNYKLQLSGAASSFATSPSLALYDTTVGSPGSRNWLIGNVAATNYGELNFCNSSAAGGAPTNVRMTLDTSGNVGIGVTPSAWNSSYRAIEIAKTGNSIFSNNASNNNILFTQNAYYDGSWKYGYTALAAHYEIQNGAHKWNTAASGTAGNTISWTQAMTLDASGNLLVGTTAMPSGVTYARLVAKSTSADWSGVIWNSNATPYGFRIQHDTDSNGTGNEFLYCLGSTNLRASIRSNGGLANYQANDVNLSDIRTKTDIKPLASYWNKIKSLELVTFKYKDQTHNDDNIGLIAQQVESVAPELVDVDGFGETPSDGVPLKTIYTTDLYHASIKALQEAMTRIEALEAKLA